MRTHYDALGVRPHDDDETIRLAFRMLAKAWHPDSNPGDRWSEQRFKQITAAYVALRNSASRAAYDELLHSARRRRREQRLRELVYCVIAAAVTFSVASGGILYYGQQHAATVSADASPTLEMRWQTALRDHQHPQDQERTVSVKAETPAPPQGQVVVLPPPAVSPGIELRDEAAGPRSPERVGATTGGPAANVESAGEAAHQPGSRAGSAMPMDTAEVRVTDGSSGEAVRTFRVPREADRSAGDTQNPSARGHRARIRIWTAGRGDRVNGLRARRMHLFTVEREQRDAKWSTSVTSSNIR